MSFKILPCVGACAYLVSSGALFAQTQSRDADIPVITVTANPLGTREPIAPVQSLSGSGLLLRQQSTLGELLQGLPGVSSTYFGPNSSRPIIRGLDGDRIRLLSNSGAMLDASALSFDHAVAYSPIALERVEVLRGSGALLYGGSAAGGVVNMIDNRIPKNPISGFSGKVDMSLDSVNSGKLGAFMLQGGDSRYALHVDASSRDQADTKRVDSKDCAGALTKTICNSSASTDSGAVGGTVFFSGGFLGVSTSSYHSNYGTVAEDDVRIDMKSRTTALHARVSPGGLWKQLDVQASRTRYTHSEIETGTTSKVGTVFANRGSDMRLHAQHEAVAGWSGVLGLQLDRTQFSADGSEAFMPYTRTQQQAVFVHEERSWPWGKATLGARLEKVKVRSDAHPQLPQFFAATVDASPKSFAAGVQTPLNSRWQLSANLASNQRALKDYELFANGPHLATASYEMGNATLAKESSRSLDVGARYKQGANTFEATLFTHRYRNYTYLAQTGQHRGADGELNPLDSNGDGLADGSGARILPEYIYTQVRARFAGFELHGNTRLVDAGYKFDVQWRADVTRASNSDTGQALPRISPLRVGATAVWTQGPWSARFGADRYQGARDGSTQAYTLANLAATHKMSAKNADLLWFAKVDNVFNRLAYSATSILTTSAPGRSPLPARGLKLGLQAQF